MVWILTLLTVVLIVVVFKFIIAISAFEALLVKFIETNEDFYKKQQHMLIKVQESVNGMKKLPSSVSTFKRTVSKLDEFKDNIKDQKNLIIKTSEMVDQIKQIQTMVNTTKKSLSDTNNSAALIQIKRIQSDLNGIKTSIQSTLLRRK